MKTSMTGAALARAALSLAIVLAWPSTAPAQEAGDDWSYIVAPYFLAPNMDGSVGIRGADVGVDADPSDIFDSLQFGFMAYFEAQGPAWSYRLDGLYMDLEQDLPLADGEVGMDQAAIEAAAFRRVNPYLEVLAGGRVNILGASIRREGLAGAIDEDRDETWFDPFIGARLQTPPGGRWTFGIRGDVGGFGVGSDFAWQIHPTVGYRISTLVEAVAGYRFLGMDYESGEGSERFRYDVTTFGPELGVAFHF